MRRTLALGFALLCLGLLPLDALSQTPWEDVPAPVTGGLFSQPALLAIGNKVHLFWAGTTGKIPDPELMYCKRAEGDQDWSEPRAPFFGRDQGRVRRLAVAGTRHTIGVVFQRQLTQGHRAFEILFTASPDLGWAFTEPIVVDSFVCEHPRGTSLSVAARDHLQRVEYAAAWATEGSGIKAALLNLRDNVRAPARTLGSHGPLSDRVQIGGHAKGGFGVVWSTGQSLRSVRLKAMSGEADEPQTLVTKNVGPNFSVATRLRGPLELVATLDRDNFLFRFNDGSWERQTTPAVPAGATPPVPGTNPAATLDSDDHRHVLYSLSTQVYYVHDRGGDWSVPEKVFDLKSPDAVFSIACTDQYV
ncbi:MAG: hypothetical protein AB1758_27950, partial [Candidatus Eremiobacterota bacterium]